MSSSDPSDSGNDATISLNAKASPSGELCDAAPDEPKTIGHWSGDKDGKAPSDGSLQTWELRYRVEGKLGTGGFSEVFTAHDRQLKRHVALKISKRAYANRDGQRKFFNEARTIAQLDHPNILPIYDIGLTERGEVFVVTKLVSNGDLSQAIAKKTLSRDVTIEIVASIADALYHAHKHSVLHRDISSANILIDENKHAYLADFGLALRENEVFPDNVLAGTIPYMSPEQAKGEVHRLDPRTDIYSLGVVLYEMLTGLRPFASTNRNDLIRKIIYGEAKPLRQIDETIPEELEKIVLKALSKQIADRHLTALDFAKDLRNFLASQQSKSTDIADQLLEDANVSDSDVVISFAQVDDHPLTWEKRGWITNFRKNVALRVEQLMGESVRIVGVAGKRESHLAETIVDSLDSVKTMVSVVSPTFTKAHDCRKIVERFANVITRNQQHSRLIKVVKTPVDPKEIPVELQTIFSKVQEFTFFEQEEISGKIRELDEGMGERTRLKYLEKIYDVADAIYRALKDSPKSSDSQSRDGDADKLVVYLAETTTDLAADREMLARELVAKGCTVLPNNPLPRTFEEVESQVRKDIAAASMCIHPIGSVYGFIPEGADESVVAIQYRVIAATKCPQIIWIPRDRVIKDPKQEAWIREITLGSSQPQGLEIVEDRISALKELLLHRIQRKRSSPTTPELLESAPRLYLICDPVDEEQTVAIERFFYSQGIEVLLPAFELGEAESQSIHISNLATCDGALVYYGNTTRHWVDSHARELIKATGYRDSRPINARLIYVAVPIDHRKERFRSLTTDLVHQVEGSGFAELISFAEQLKKEAELLRASRVVG